jgi:hypothetical protein
MKIMHAGGSLQRLTEGRVGNSAGKRNQILMARRGNSQHEGAANLCAGRVRQMTGSLSVPDASQLHFL